LLLAAALVTSKLFASEREPNQLFAETSLSSSVRAERPEGGSSARGVCLKLSAEGPYCFTNGVGTAKNLSSESCSYLEQTIGRAGGSGSLGGKTDVYSLA
jgi:hypothetical protein